MSGTPRRIVPAAPESSRIADVHVLPRTIHQDPRGSLVETLRSDDRGVDGGTFLMSYTSVTMPGEFRDRDRWHVHALQTDRFIVPVGEMLLALLDQRASSPTRSRFELLRLAGPALRAAAQSAAHESTTHLVTIPPGVYHCIGNRGTEPFLLQNFPTQLYSKADEERVPFASVPIAELEGPFDWGRVEGVRERGGS